MLKKGQTPRQKKLAQWRKRDFQWGPTKDFVRCYNRRYRAQCKDALRHEREFPRPPRNSAKWDWY